MPYFCLDQNVRHLELAQPFEGNAQIARFAALAGETGIVLPIGFFERAGNAAYNSIAVADADGRVLGVYRKTHIPDGPGYTEKFYFTPGDTGFKVWDTRFGRIGIGICWDQWYPETARSLALMGAEILCFPTIIGSEPFSSAFDSSGHWQRTMQGHAAANMVPVVAANRIGREVGFGNGNPAQQKPRACSTGRVSSRITPARSGPRRTAPMKPCSCTRSISTRSAPTGNRGAFRDRRPEMYRTLLTSDGVSSCYR